MSFMESACKYVVVYPAVAFVALGVGIIVWPRDEVKVAACIQTHGKQYCDTWGNFMDEKKAKIDAARQSARDAAAAAATPEGKTNTFTSQAFTLCRQDVRDRAKFPTKVDFDWGSNASKYWMNFSEGRSRVLIQNTGEMMNGLGMMVPFKATCKYDFDPKTNTYSTVEILI